MAVIGNLGKIIFETSDEKILTFSGFSQSIKGRWSTHDIIGKKPRSEFLGAGLRTVNFKIVLSAMHGVRPRKTLKTMESMAEKGTAEQLVIGGKKIGNNCFVITSLSETWDCVYAKGELVKATVSVSLTEYV